MKLLQMTYLIALREAGSFSAAAQKLYTSQPAVSSAIKELEEELGCTLLIRESRGVRFTEKGEAVLEQAEAIMAAVKKIEDVSGVDTGLKYPVRLGTTPAIANSILWEFNEKLERDNPGLMMTLQAYNSLELLDKVRHQEMDMAVLVTCDIPTATIEEATRQGFEFSTLFTQKLFIACRPGHPLTELSAPSVEDIMKYPFVTFHDMLEEEVRRLLAHNRYDQRIIQINDLIGLRRYICTTDAITSHTTMALKNGNDNLSYRLVALDVPQATWDVAVALVYKKKEMSRAEKLVMEALRSLDWYGSV